MRRTHRVFVTACAVLLLLSAASDAAARKKDKAKPEDDRGNAVAVERWLVLGPAAHPLPAFHDDGKGGVDLSALLDSEMLPSVRIEPSAGDSLRLFGPESLRWTERAGDDGGTVGLDAAGETPAVAWLAAYVTSTRWQSTALEITGAHPRRAWLDGEPLASGGTGAADDKVETTLKLSPGRHVLLIRTIRDPEREEPWGVGAWIGGGEEEAPPELAWGTDRRRGVELRDIIDAPQVGSMAVAPGGGRYVVAVRRVVPGTHQSESWVEVRESRQGTLERSWRGSLSARQVAFSPDGRYVSYVATAPGSEGKRSTIFLLDVDGGDVRPLFDGAERLNGYRWSPDGRTIAFWETVEAEENESGVKRLEGVMDRWSSFRNKQFLHLVSVPDGARRRLTAGALSTPARDFSPDGKRLLFSRQVEDFARRPYSRNELWELDLQSFEARKLREFNWLNSATYAPDGRRLLIGAHAAEFDGAGVDVDEGTIPNSYDGQLFIWDPATDEVDPITRDFDPAADSAVWSRADGRIYFRATERDYSRLYRYDPDTRRFASIDVDMEVVGSFATAAAAPTALVRGSSTWTPERLVVVDLSSDRIARMPHPGDDWFRGVGHGGVESFSFEAANGKTIDGRVYLPPGFDSERRYPAIVYYYGGTVPVNRAFGGRYPKEWWAANGYVVYVPQPSGATGFGQEFSAAHVNDWGRTTSEEIIEGTRKFLAAHPFVDPDRVGCIGASFGGFMTMLLSTQSDLFASAVAHAGISSISSYWGEGYWGYAYNSVAGADSFPWNRRDIYVDQSPLFRADQNRVPILLTHGTADTNVPVGESDAFYVALKLLGKDVEYVQFAGEDHWILDHAKRQIWSASIVAWFDRWLKDSPEWWNELYPSPEAEQDE